MDRKRQGQAPYGYCWKGGVLVSVTEETRIRRLAVELMLTLRSCAAVARELNTRKVRTRRDGEWSDVQIARILACPTAIGKYQPPAPTMSARPPMEPVECEPIVSMEVWERIQATLKSRAKGKAKPVTAQAKGSLFSGLLWCGCSRRLEVVDEKASCSGCGMRVPPGEIEAVFAADFYELLSVTPILAAALCGPSQTRDIHASLAAIHHQLDIARAKRDSLERLLNDRAISRKRFVETHPVLEREIRAMETRARQLQQQLPPAGAKTLPVIGPHEWQRQWAAWPAQHRRQIVQTFVDRITIRPGEIEIAYLLSDSSTKETDPIQQISHPTFQAPAGQPTYIRLPKPGEKCPITGLSRAKLNELVLPNERNGFDPPVASKSIRQNGAQRGIRLVLLESLMAYLSGSV